MKSYTTKLLSFYTVCWKYAEYRDLVVSLALTAVEISVRGATLREK
jgi:hypothetical protein